MTRYLLMAEKSSQAKKIADAFQLSRNGKNYRGLLDGHEITLWYAAGHLVEPVGPDKYNEFSWEDPKTHERIETFTPFQVCPDIPARGDLPERKPGEMIDNLRALVAQADVIVGATDPDREGEVIYRSILQYLNYNGPLERMWLSKGLGANAINLAFSSRQPAMQYLGTYYAGLGRRYADNSSMILTANYTYYGRRGMLGKTLGTGDTGQESTVSVGRVQSTVVSIVYLRKQERANFTPQTHYTPAPTFAFPGGIELQSVYKYSVTPDIANQPIAGVEWQEPKVALEPEGDNETLDDESEIKAVNLPSPLFTSKARVEQFSQSIKASLGTIVDHSNKPSKKNPPKPYSMSQLQAAMPGRKVDEILAAGQQLYDKGYLSYPRTDDPELPVEDYDSHKLQGILGDLANWPEFSAAATWALNIHLGKDPKTQAFKPACYKDSDRPHDGLTPVDIPSPGSLSGLPAEIFLLVAKRFIQTHLPASVYQVIEATIEVPVTGLLNEPVSHFKAGAKACIDTGWEAAFSDKEQEANIQAPNFSQSADVKAVSVELKESTTKIPPLYNSSSLQNAMRHAAKFEKDPVKRERLKESKGIGTPATRPTILTKIILRNYIAYQKGKSKESTQIDITPKGVELLRVVPASMRTPSVTAAWEDCLHKIETSRDEEDVRDKYQKFVLSQVASAEKLVKTMNDQLLHKAPKNGTHPNAPATKATLEKLKKRAKALGVSLPREALAREIHARAWLKANPPKMTPALLKTVQRINSELSIPIPEGATKDFFIALDFVKQHQSNLSELPPSDEMISFAEKLATQSGVPLPDETRNNKSALSVFIEKLKKEVPPSDGQVNYLRKLALQVDVQLAAADYRTADITSANINKLKKLASKKRSNSKKATQRRR